MPVLSSALSLSESLRRLRRTACTSSSAMLHSHVVLLASQAMTVQGESVVEKDVVSFRKSGQEGTKVGQWDDKAPPREYFNFGSMGKEAQSCTNTSPV
jgi:hypothetical protein